MITLDASIVIAHLSPDDPHHVAAVTYLRDVATEGFVMHSLNVAEVLVGGVRAGRGQEMLDDLHAMGVRAAEQSSDEPLRLAVLRTGSRLKLPDCCALHTALSVGTTLATFDAALATAAREHQVSVAPEPGHARRRGMRR